MANQSIRIMIVDDHPVVRQGFAGMIATEPEMLVVAEARDGEQAVEAFRLHRPDVTLMDLRMPAMNGVQAITEIRKEFPRSRFIVLTTYDGDEDIYSALRAGAQGYLLKKMLPGELVPAVEQVHAGGAPMSMQIARKVVDYFHQIRRSADEMQMLTAREQEILTLLAKGNLYKEIGERLGISFSTVRAHLRHIYEKLHVRSRTEATAKFLRQH